MLLLLSGGSWSGVLYNAVCCNVDSQTGQIAELSGTRTFEVPAVRFCTVVVGSETGSDYQLCYETNAGELPCYL